MKTQKFLSVLLIIVVFAACNKSIKVPPPTPVNSTPIKSHGLQIPNIVSPSREIVFNYDLGSDGQISYIERDTNLHGIYIKDLIIDPFTKTFSLPTMNTLSMQGFSIDSTDVLKWKLISINTDYTNTVAVSGSGGNAIFYITNTKLSSGTARFTTIDAVVPIVNDAATNYTYGWSYNSTTKALTVNVKSNPGLVVGLLTLLGLPTNVANGTNVQVIVKGH